MSTMFADEDTLTRVVVQETLPGDADTFSHYTESEKITEARVFGLPLKALCGKVWVPSRDPQKFPVCPECKEIYDTYSDEPLGSDDE